METSISVKVERKPAIKSIVVYPSLRLLGYWSSIASLVFAWGYSAAQLLTWFQIISYPHDLFWLFFPSLFLAPAFLVNIICLHFTIRKERRIWSAIGAAFAIIYCALATLTYFTQLGSVVPGIIKGQITESHVLFFKPRSFTISIDCLGYFFMSLATLFTGFAFRRKDRRLYLWFLLNGLLLTVLVPAYFYPFLYYFGSVWIVTFSLSMIYSARVFK
jgi:hypothetical protein